MPKTKSFYKKKDSNQQTSSTVNYEVEMILDETRIDGKNFYLLKWKHYPHGENSWEPETNLKCDRLLYNFKNNRKIFNVEKILHKKIKNGVPYYLVKWESYSNLHNTWEPKRNMFCIEMVKQFDARFENKHVSTPSGHC